MKSKQKEKKPLTIEQKIRRRNFISFGVFGALGAAAYQGWQKLYNAPKEVRTVTAGAKEPLRRALNKTELFFRNFFSSNHLVKTYPKNKAARVVRHNSDIGSNGNPGGGWTLFVTRRNGEKFNVTMDQIRAMPKTEIVYGFKCVEGWSQIQYWGGVKFIDFLDHFNLDKETELAYVGMNTPDKKYYVGLDMASAVHPQTILAYEMNAKPLLSKHGAPLRLIIPVKYGIKNIKRIGNITFSDSRPPDYWAEQGYDYYSGL